ncbi:MAG: VOC family protein [Chloroflexi bacterium]|nr:VOC family protein [Chloroflexota bacterium]
MEGGRQLGAFSVSLAVKDIQTSRQFHEKLGFEAIGGNWAQNWLILRNSGHTIGLFQGIFEGDIITFNQGWDDEAQPLDSFTETREIQRQLKSKRLEFIREADESTSGPASFMTQDPDGNTILVDQHV